ncbi:S8/S53 family peptidase [Flavobacterium sp. JP2137]|uniref:S8/S53 family peptidase n=1 Tax=Flavobacterium sp. JP2137 TaxID=3414510 RepID=UPI003D2FEA8A
MKYVSIIKMSISSFLLLGAQWSFSQSQSLRNTISREYNKERIDALIKQYKRVPPMQHSKGSSQAFDENRLWIEVDALGNDVYYKANNRVSAVTVRVNDVNSGGSEGLDLNGEGMIIGAWDAGIPRLDHVDLLGKITVKDESTVGNITRHATHVSGTLVSEGSQQSRGQGLAPRAHLWVSNWKDDLEKMIRLAGQGLLVSNHSYGVDPADLPLYYFGAYTKTTQGLDALTYAMKYYQPVVAAGNDRRKYMEYNPTKEGTDLLTAMAVAKNAVVVAAIYPVFKYQGPKDVVMTDFSNWGPTDDFRIKPDIAALGLGVYSTTEDTETSYGTLSGTSMAAPAVTAVFALWQQYYGNLHNQTKALTSASIRALMAHTADEAGPFDGPDHQFGWGLLNAVQGVRFLKSANAEQGRDFMQESILGQGEENTYTIQLSEPTDKLVLTMAWTDSEGEIKLGKTDDATPDLVNDLNVVMQKDGNVYYPWRLQKNRANPLAEKGINDVDNIEKIEIPNPERGEYTVKVTHAKKLFSGEQAYSLLISGFDKVAQNKTEFNQGARIWPNPASDYLSISMGEMDLNGGKVQIYDTNGKNVLQINSLVADRITIGKINVSTLKPGVYFLKFNKLGFVKVFNLIKT